MFNLDFIFKQHEPNILVLNETKLLIDDVAEVLCNDIYYICHRNTQLSNSRSRTGGAAIFVKNNMFYKQATIFNHLDLDIVSVNVETKQGTILIVGYYNPNEPMLNGEVFSLLLGIESFILVGDLNVKNWRNNAILSSFLQSNKVKLLNNEKEPTTDKQTLLDLCIASNKAYEHFGTIDVLKDSILISDHYPLKVHLKCEILNKKQSIDNKYHFDSLDEYPIVQADLTGEKAIQSLKKKFNINKEIVKNLHNFEFIAAKSCFIHTNLDRFFR